METIFSNQIQPACANRSRASTTIL